VPGDTPSAAVDAYVAPLQRSISCVTRALLGVAAGRYVSEKPHILTLLNGAERLSRGERPGLVLSVSQQYQIVTFESRYRVHTLSYAYKLDDADDGHEIMAYHWHPQQYQAVQYPHLHLSYGARIGRDEFQKAHVPTGRIALEDFIQFLIEAFDVVPIREDWRDVINETRSQFLQYRSWG